MPTCGSCPQYSEGDTIINIGNHDAGNDNLGKTGVVTSIVGGKVYVKYNMDGSRGSCELELAYKYYKVIERNNKTTIMKDIVSFARGLVLSKEEKLLRKFNLKDDCGDYTHQAREILMQKFYKDNEKYLVEIATALEEENKKD